MDDLVLEQLKLSRSDLCELKHSIDTLKLNAGSLDQRLTL